MAKVKMVIKLLISIFIAFGIPYIIQFKLNFLGANFITIKDIVGLWWSLALLGFVFFVISENK
jgi:hypothetical protein